MNYRILVTELDVTDTALPTDVAIRDAAVADEYRRFLDATLDQPTVTSVVTWGLTAVFIVFGLYALAGAGVIGGLPFVQAGVVVIGGIYTLRGLVVVLDLVRLSRGAGYPERQTVFSAVSLGVGLMYLAGAFWRSGSSREGAHVAG